MIEVLVLMEDILDSLSWGRGVIITSHICAFHENEKGTCVELMNGNMMIIKESIDELAIKISASKAFVFNVN